MDLPLKRDWFNAAEGVGDAIARPDKWPHFLSYPTRHQERLARKIADVGPVRNQAIQA